VPSRESARRGSQLLRAMIGRGYLGCDPEAIGMVLDVCCYVEDDAMADGAKTFDEVMVAVIRAVESSVAGLGMEVHGELRGLLQDADRPETANGFAVSVGGGLPPGWSGWRALQDENARLRAELEEYRAMKIAVEQTPKQWSTAQAPTLEALAATAQQITTAEENKKLRAQVEGLAERVAAQSELLARRSEKPAA
jgi:hypothetical protein